MCTRREKRGARAGILPRLLRPIKAQFKATRFFFFFFPSALRMPHSNAGEWWTPTCVHGNMIGEISRPRRNGGPRDRAPKYFYTPTGLRQDRRMIRRRMASEIDRRRYFWIATLISQKSNEKVFEVQWNSKFEVRRRRRSIRSIR